MSAPAEVEVACFLPVQKSTFKNLGCLEFNLFTSTHVIFRFMQHCRAAYLFLKILSRISVVFNMGLVALRPGHHPFRERKKNSKKEKLSFLPLLRFYLSVCLSVSLSAYLIFYSKMSWRTPSIVSYASFAYGAPLSISVSPHG